MGQPGWGDGAPAQSAQAGASLAAEGSGAGVMEINEGESLTRADGAERAVVERRHTAVIKYNSSVYATASSTVASGMAGMVTRRAKKPGDILCVYEGVRLSKEGARTSTMQRVHHAHAGTDARRELGLQGQG